MFIKTLCLTVYKNCLLTQIAQCDAMLEYVARSHIFVVSLNLSDIFCFHYIS